MEWFTGRSKKIYGSKNTIFDEVNSQILKMLNKPSTFLFTINISACNKTTYSNVPKWEDRSVHKGYDVPKNHRPLVVLVTSVQSSATYILRKLARDRHLQR